jgi:HD-like signal output (HDOD) protein
MISPAPQRSLKDLLQGAQLPAMPQSALRLLEISQDDSKGPSDFAVPIEADPGLASQVLRFVNSSYFSFTREISSVRFAINLVGVRTVKNFALWSAVFSLIPNPKCGPFDLRNLWVDSLRRGLFSRHAGKALGVQEADDLFAAALLQDMAVPVLAKELPEEYARMLAARQINRIRLSELEQAAFGWDHAVAGGMIARHWRLPEVFAALVEQHTQLDSLLASGSTDYGSIAVGLSALTPGVHDEVWHDAELMHAHWQQLTGGRGQPLSELFTLVDKEFADIGPLLKLPEPKRTLNSFCEGLELSAAGT